MTKAKAVHKICKVGYEHLGGFQVISDNFFTLFSRPSNFIDLYQNRDLDEIVNQISQNLYEAFVCMKLFPQIRTDQQDDQINLLIAQRLNALL